MKKIVSILIIISLLLIPTANCFAVSSEVSPSKTVFSKFYPNKVMAGSSSVGGPRDATEEQFPIFKNDVAKIREISAVMESAIENYTDAESYQIDIDDDYIPDDIILSKADLSSFNIPMTVNSDEGGMCIYQAYGDGNYTYSEDGPYFVPAPNDDGDIFVEFVCNDLFSIYSQIIDSNPYLFSTVGILYSYNLPSKITFDGECTGGKILAVGFCNTMTKQEYDDSLTDCKQQVNNIVNGVNKNFTDLEKMLYLHNYICNNFKYQASAVYGNQQEQNARIGDIYNFLKEKTGVCQSYALLFKAFMDKMGIECHTAVSESQSHIWNIVKLNGHFYHIDCTHDDPIYGNDAYDYGCDDVLGFCEYSHFLLTDSELYSLSTSNNNDPSHLEWYTVPSYETPIECDDNSYSNADFKTVEGFLNYYNGYWYGVETGLPTNIVRFDSDLENKTVLATHKVSGYGNVSSFPHTSYIYGDTLIFSDIEEISFYNIKTGTMGTILNYDPKVNGAPSGCYNISIGKIGYYYDNDFANKANRTILIGDANSDNEHNAADLTLLTDYILGNDDIPSIQKADTNFDAVIDITDLVRLKMIIANQ